MPEEFEWDETKRLSNIDKHQLDFTRAALLFDGRPRIDRDSNRFDEIRHLSTGMVDGKCISVVWTRRGRMIRIISARRARDAEEREYRQTHGERA